MYQNITNTEDIYLFRKLIDGVIEVVTVLCKIKTSPKIVQQQYCIKISHLSLDKPYRSFPLLLCSSSWQQCELKNKLVKFQNSVTCISLGQLLMQLSYFSLYVHQNIINEFNGTVKSWLS